MAPVSCTTCLTKAACLEACLHPLLGQPPVLKPVYATCLVLAPVLVPLFHCHAKSGRPCKGVDWQCGVQDGGSSGSCRQNAHTIHPCEDVQCDGTMADVKMLVAFTSQRSPGCFNDVLHDILEGNPNLQLVVVRPNGEDLQHLFEYTTATVNGEGRQETVCLENLDDGCLDLCTDAPQGASRKNTSWRGPLQHRLCLSMEKDPSLSSPVYPLRSDSPHQWSEHGPGTTCAVLWGIHHNNPITILEDLPGLSAGVLYHNFAGLSSRSLTGCKRPLRVAKSSPTLCLPSWCAFPVNHRGMFIVLFKDALFMTMGSSSPPTL